MSNALEQIKALASELRSQVPIKAELVTDQRYNRPEAIKLLAVALYAAGYTTRAIASQLDASQASVVSWINNPKYNGEESSSDDSLSDVSAHIKDTLSKKLYLIASKSFNHAMEDDKIEKASSLQLATVGAIAIEKARLLEGSSTENISHLYRKSEKTKGQKETIDAEIKELEALL